MTLLLKLSNGFIYAFFYGLNDLVGVMLVPAVRVLVKLKLRRSRFSLPRLGVYLLELNLVRSNRVSGLVEDQEPR